MHSHDSSRRRFVRHSGLLLGGLPLARSSAFASLLAPDAPAKPVHNKPLTLVNDPRVKLSFDEERLVLDDGLQPSMLCTREGTIIVQAQISKKAAPRKRMFYPYETATVVSHDVGNTWQTVSSPNINEVNLEGGIHELKDGTIMALDTYVTPGDKPDTGVGQMYLSHDQYATLEGPIAINFHIPNADFYASSDDGGRPHPAMRLHRRILELPGGDLLTTIYGFQKGDKTPSPYTPTMMKSRVMLFRSKDKGHNWEYVSTVAVDGTVGTEGFGEPTITRVSHGKHAGRLICMARTGQALYETHSDDDGRTWAKPYPRMFADRDVFKTSEWLEMFKDVKRRGVLISELPSEITGAVVDPDLIELNSGVLVAAFGIRIPARANFARPQHPWNGNYLAFSLDHGDTYSHVVQLTSGITTTQYMAIEPTPTKNELFAVYDYGYWGSRVGRYIYGRKVKVDVHGSLK